MGKVTRLGGTRGDTRNQRLHLREIPGEAERPQEGIGQDLRFARLSRGEELGHASHALRIRKGYLEALESDSPDKLPGRTYALGFVRAYANYLGLDAAAMVTRYKLATEGLVESGPRVGPPPESTGSWPGLGWIMSALAVGVLLVYGAYQMSRPSVPGGATTPAPAATRVLAKSPSNTTVAHPVQVATAPRALPGTSVQEPAGAGSDATGQVFGQQNRNTRVVLHVRALTHLLVEGPGGRIYINRVLHPGDVYRVPNMVGLSLTTSDGGAVWLEVDGQDIGAAGKPGRITEALSLDPRAIVNRKGGRSAVQPDKVTP